MNKKLVWKDKELVTLPKLVRLIKNEHLHQMAKWGVQIRTAEEWMLYLTEEVGELAEAVSEYKYRKGEKKHIELEAIQVVTLALKVAEMSQEVTV